MKVIRGLENYPSVSSHSIVAIGNFDGVHLGHQKILRCLEKKAKEYDLFSLVLTFFPHPGQVLVKDGIKMIQTLDQRIRGIKKFDIQAALIIPFDERFAQLSGQEFIRNIILKRLKAQAVIVGENFHFGKNREGDTGFLQHLASKYNFRICPVPSVIKDREAVSSSLIRSYLREGKVERASRLLGRSYEIEGTVIRGQSRGKALGFPTANIETENDIIPPGVFITQTRIGTQILSSMTNVGSQPTFDQQGINIESYILNFEKNLYGKHIGIRFLKKIRNEIKFKTPDDLAMQLEKDMKATQMHFGIKNRISD